jgi:flagellar hook-associated protein 2
VSQLAQAQTLTTKSTQADTKTAIATADKITFTAGNGKTRCGYQRGKLLAVGIRDAINKADAGVTASIINVGNGQYRLSITSTETGSDNAVSISVSGDSACNPLWVTTAPAPTPATA